MDTFDPKRLALKRSTMNPILEQSTVQNTRLPRHHANGHFLKASFIWFAKAVAAINKSSDSINIPRFFKF